MGFNDSKLVQWAAVKEDGHCPSSSVSDSTSSSLSPSPSLVSLELSDDASSSSSTTTAFIDNSSSGPLYELADLMAQLPIKRGLSKFYNGKSQTFASLSNVRSVDDLGKKEMSFSSRMKSCKSYGGNLNIHKFGPKPIIAKRPLKTPCLSSFAAKTTFLHI